MIKKIACLVVLSLGWVACSSTSSTVADQDPRTPYTEEQEAQSITQQVAKTAEANYFTEIAFKKGSSKLTPQSKKYLDELLTKAKHRGSLDEIKVLSWADQEYPSQKVKELNEKQRKLADARNKTVAEYLRKNTYAVNVDTHNMAEQPNVVAEWLNTEDAKFKSSLVEAGLPTTSDAPKYPSKASHAIVLVALKK